LIDREVGDTHDAGGLFVGHVELVRHHLAKRRARALAQVGFADVERRSVVLMNHDPGIKLQEIRIRIRTCRALRACNRREGPRD
jgi:hypothetical protein